MFYNYLGRLGFVYPVKSSTPFFPITGFRFVFVVFVFFFLCSWCRAPYVRNFPKKMGAPLP